MIVSLITQDTIQQAADEFAEANNTTSSSGGSAQQVGGIIFSLVFAAAFVALALGLLRAANVARIITWVLCGLGLCCTGVISAFSLILVEYLPGGYVAYMYTVTAVTLIIYIAIIVLLALPASNAYFRRPKAGF
ncbi:hypothetical protein [Cryptosporangium aurantiacum]|uniref:hypothetical protein n=1 Tax=Cryptosporangium aurantiacum TaxID=134849 RepID=UPI0011614438|nr:hypothetical protein [Cryptosporangium aurantiacum]